MAFLDGDALGVDGIRRIGIKTLDTMNEPTAPGNRMRSRSQSKHSQQDLGVDPLLAELDLAVSGVTASPSTSSSLSMGSSSGSDMERSGSSSEDETKGKQARRVRRLAFAPVSIWFPPGRDGFLWLIVHAESFEENT